MTTEQPVKAYTAVPRFISEVPAGTDISNAYTGAEALKLPLLPQGEQVAGIMEATDEEGFPLFPEIVIQMGRRSTKSSSVQAVLVGRCFNIPGYQIVFTAQNQARAQDFMRELGRLLEASYPDEDTRPFRFYRSNGGMRIVWDNGSQWRCVRPEAGAFRGSAANCLWFDEAGEYDRAKTEDLVSGALPLLDTKADGQIIISGTPALVRDGMLWDYLTAARKGKEGLGILDYSMAPTDDPTDEALWWRVHPGLASGLTRISVLRKRFEILPLVQFQREYLCADPVAASLRAIPEEDWLAGQVPDLLELPKDNFSISWDITIDGSAAAVAIAWYSPEGIPFVQILRHDAGYSWLPSYIGKLLTEHRGAEIGYDVIGHNLSVFQSIQRMPRVPKTGLRDMSMKEVSAGASLFVAAVSDRALVHAKDASLDKAAEEVAFRYSGDSRLFGRRQSSADISPLIAASNALYIATGKRHKDTRKPRGLMRL